MSVDLQFLQFNDVLDLNGVKELPGFKPRILELRGPDMRSAVEVYINDYKSPTFVIKDRNTIVAEVPRSLEDQTIRSVSVLSSEFTATVRSQLRFRIGSNPSKASGLKAMMQTFVKWLFSNTGSDIFNKGVGGDALKHLGEHIDEGDGSALVTDFAIAVNRTASQIRAAQDKQRNLNDDERLLAANLINIRFDPVETALIARIELISRSGKRAIANVEL